LKTNIVIQETLLPLQPVKFVVFADDCLRRRYLESCVYSFSKHVPFSVPEKFFRHIFVLFLPGYAVTKALFTKNILGKATSKELETIARVALSVGLSIALVSIVGLFCSTHHGD